MRVRYGKQALKQVTKALSFVQDVSPQGADEIVRRLDAILVLLAGRPYLGRPTSRPGVRRVSVRPFPYTLDYRIVRDEIVLLRFRHTARRPLP